MLTKKLEPRVARSIEHLLRHLDSGALDDAAPWHDDADATLALVGYDAAVNLDRFSIKLGCVIG